MSETQIKITRDRCGWLAQVVHSDEQGVTRLETVDEFRRAEPRPTLDALDREMRRAIHESHDDIGPTHGGALLTAWAGQVQKARDLA